MYHFSIMKNKKIALAIDNIIDLDEIATLIKKTSRWVQVYKIGLEQFIRFGPAILETVRSTGREIFLDLKLHDIPNTVAKAVRSVCSHNVDYLTIHSQGGSAMMKAASEAKKAFSPASDMKIIGVTLLTSIDETALSNELCVPDAPRVYVKHLAELAVQSAIDGIVCSAADLSHVAPAIPDRFEVITPGIRPAGTDTHDQKRVATPAQAVAAGATMLVIGRAITAAPDPSIAAESIYNEVFDL
jgi:orotidine-5'-phosphate decarboxylase